MLPENSILIGAVGFHSLDEENNGFICVYSKEVSKKLTAVNIAYAARTFIETLSSAAAQNNSEQFQAEVVDILNKSLNGESITFWKGE